MAVPPKADVPLAEELLAAGVPFVFATGYGDDALIAGGFTAAPVVRKPFDAPALAGALVAAMERG